MRYDVLDILENNRCKRKTRFKRASGLGNQVQHRQRFARLLAYTPGLKNSRRRIAVSNEQYNANHAGLQVRKGAHAFNFCNHDRTGILMSVTKSQQITIIRAAKGRENPYFMMLREIPQRLDLSYEAAGMLSYLLSKPNDWKIVPANLKRQGCGRDKVYRILGELREAGYLHLSDQRQTDGTFQAGEYLLYEQPYTEKPDTAEPDTEKPTLHNRESTDKRETEKEKESAARDVSAFDAAGDTSAFEEFVDTLDIEESAAPVTPPATPKRFDALQEAVCIAFQDRHKGERLKPGKWPGRLGAFLTGVVTSAGKGTKWEEYRVHEPPMTPPEIIGLGAWYYEHPKYGKDGEGVATLPTTPETLAERVEEFRASSNHASYVETGTRTLHILRNRQSQPVQVEEDAPQTPEQAAMAAQIQERIRQIAEQKGRVKS